MKKFCQAWSGSLDCICILQSRDPDQADKILTELQVNPEFLRTQEYRRAIAYLASPLLRTYRSKLENRHQHPGTYVKEKIEEILSSPQTYEDFRERLEREDPPSFGQFIIGRAQNPIRRETKKPARIELMSSCESLGGIIDSTILNSLLSTNDVSSLFMDIERFYTLLPMQYQTLFNLMVSENDLCIADLAKILGKKTKEIYRMRHHIKKRLRAFLQEARLRLHNARTATKLVDANWQAPTWSSIV